jgi:hypothetical protein
MKHQLDIGVQPDLFLPSADAEKTLADALAFMRPCTPPDCATRRPRPPPTRVTRSRSPCCAVLSTRGALSGLACRETGSRPFAVELRPPHPRDSPRDRPAGR